MTVAAGQGLRLIREQKPLVHQITNYVVMNETANATLALGALPVMAHALEEVEQMASAAGALVLNIGTLSPQWVEAMLLAGRAANAAGVPVVLDPVGAGATDYRTETARRIAAEVRLAVVRGNAAEIATLAGRAAEIRGVESLGAAEPPAELARAAALRAGLRRLAHRPRGSRLRRVARRGGGERARAAGLGDGDRLHVDRDDGVLPGRAPRSPARGGRRGACRLRRRR